MSYFRVRIKVMECTIYGSRLEGKFNLKLVVILLGFRVSGYGSRDSAFRFWVSSFGRVS
jgi:hypothetical protein